MSATALPTPSQSQPPKRKRPFRLPVLGYSYPVVAVMVAAGIGGFVYVYGMLEKSRHLTGAQFRIDLSPLMAAGWVIQTHVAGAVTAFLLGLVILFLPKGVRLHRQLGWVWVVAMGTAAVASIFIRTDHGNFSWIHTFTALTLVMLPMAVAAARMHYAKLHPRFMTAVFLGGAFTAGLFTFLPGRLMWDVLFTTH